MNGIEKGVELVRQSVWGDLIALYLFLGGLGAMAFLFSYLAWRRGASRKLVLGGSLTGLISVTLFTHVRVSPDLPLLLLLRDLFLVVGSLILRRLGFVPEPSLFGKLTTLCVSLTVILAFSLNLYPIGSVVLLRRFETLSMILILVSWVEYSLRGASFLRSKLIMERR